MNSFYFWDEMAAKCLKSEHFQEAIQSYKHALESTDDSTTQASVWANIGNIYLTIQDISAAVDAFLTAARLDPTSYDFDCILERITANGYLDESAMVLAKDMYALESVKTGLEAGPEIEISPIEEFPVVDDLDAADQSPVDVPMAVNDDDAPVDMAVPAVDVDVAVTVTESPVVAEPADAVSELFPVEPASPEATSQPEAESNETEPPVEIALTEPVAQTEFFAATEDVEPVEPDSSAESSQPSADMATSEVPAESEVAETVPEPEMLELALEIAIPEPVVEALEKTVVVATPEPVAEETNSEFQAVVESLETTAEIATPELVAEETQSEAPTIIEESEKVADLETSPIAAGQTGAEAAAETASTEAYIEVPVDQILENPLHLRVSMQSEELVESVRQHGILQPLIVTSLAEGKYMVVAGNRRLEAARLAGLEYVPVIVRPAAERDFLELALIENIQRISLDPLELAEAYHLLVENLGMTPETIAASIGKNCSVVTAAINLLKLTEEGKQALREKSISEGHARALVAIELPALQNNALVYVLENRLGVRQTEDLVRIILNAVAVSRSYDESYHEETLTETPWQESSPVECTDETVLETPETETASETNLPQAESDLTVEVVVEPEAAQAVVEAADANPEPALVATASVSEAEPVVILDVSADAVIDLLVAESEMAQALVENVSAEKEVEQITGKTVLEDENIDFSWITALAEPENQVQQAEINAPAAVELSVEESVDSVVTSVAIPVESVFATANCDAARDLVIQSEVMLVEVATSPALETVFDKVEENLADVIEEIVQFTELGDAPLGDTHTEASAEQASVNPEPVAQLDGPQAVGHNEPEGPEARTQLKGLEAISVYRRVVENNPGNVRIWHLLGNLYSDLGQYEEAIDCLKRTIELDPGKYTYYYHLGLTLAIARRYPAAIQALETTIDLAPQHILAHCSLAGCYRRIGSETEAQKHIEIARPKLTQEKAYNRACFESISGNTDQAIELLQIALNTDKTPVEWLVRDPDLDFIRDDPRFQALVAELTLPV